MNINSVECGTEVEQDKAGDLDLISGLEDIIH